jgi:hypothetical protein
MGEKDAASRCVRKVMLVEAPCAVAWRVFTEQISGWWPLATHKIGRAKAVGAVIEFRVGDAGVNATRCVAFSIPSRAGPACPPALPPTRRESPNHQRRAAGSHQAVPVPADVRHSQHQPVLLQA